jgi:NMD protein affecting ribosome stability and mRNA decay
MDKHPCSKCGKPAPVFHEFCVDCIARAMEDLTVGDIAAVMAGIKDQDEEGSS